MDVIKEVLLGILYFFGGLLLATAIGIPVAFVLSYIFHFLMTVLGESLFVYCFIGAIAILFGYLIGMSKEQDRLKKHHLEEPHSQR